MTVERTPSRLFSLDPRSPRFSAWISSVLLLVATLLGLTGISAQSGTSAAFGWFAYQPLASGSFPNWALPFTPLGARTMDPAFLLTALIAVLFLWNVISPRTAPWAVLFRRFIRPRLAPPAVLEASRPLRFAQSLALAVVTIGLLLHMLGIPLALPIATAITFIATFIHAAFGFCLGCHLHPASHRAQELGRSGS